MDNISVCKVRLFQQKEEVRDISAKVRAEYGSIRKSIHPGMKIAVAVGSRGICSIDRIVKTLVDCLREDRAEPFIVPAMGSHGGATAEGQAEILRGYGITEESMGVSVRSSMKVVKLAELEEPVGLPVYMDRYAYDADGVIVTGRVKCHTDFHGSHESGIVKMLAIGLGKHAQALAVHAYGARGLRDYIPLVSRRVIESGKIMGALAILEDGYDHTADLKMAGPEEIFQVDSEFLKRSRKLIAGLPFQEIDVLIVDEMGKEISGTGMDTNIIGRIRIPGEPEGSPLCRSIAVLGLSEASHGNALGVGLADVTTKRLADAVDWKVTNENVITSGFLQRGFLPVVAGNDREAVRIAVRSCGKPDMENLKLARIRNTLNLEEVYLSGALFREVLADARGEKLTDFTSLSFDREGRIDPF